MSGIRSILIDDRSGFWNESDTWGEAFPEGESVRVGNFLPGDDPTNELLNRLSLKALCLEDIQWPSICIISDANLGDGNLDGANLLSGLHEVGKKWNRAVVYSIEPELNDFCKSLGQATVRAVFKTDNRDARKIKTFLESGVFPTLDPIWGLRRFLTPLAFCLDTLQANDKIVKEGLIFPKMKAYGIPDVMTVEDAYPFTPVLVRDDDQNLFSSKTAAYFVEESKSEFIQLAIHSIGLQHDQVSVSPEQQWLELLLALHPYESLEGPHTVGIDGGVSYPVQPLRLLWELIQTGGDLLLIPRAVDNLNSLKACERAWVRRRLMMMGERMKILNDDKKALSELLTSCKRALAKIEHQRNAIIEAERQVLSGML